MFSFVYILFGLFGAVLFLAYIKMCKNLSAKQYQDNKKTTTKNGS